MKQLLLGHDREVASWAAQAFRLDLTHYEMAVGVMEEGRVVGAALFQAHTGPDIEISYFGPNTMTLGVVKGLARVAVEAFGVSRVTARTPKSNKTMTRGIKGVGFEYEGIRHRGYGNEDAVMYGLWGEKLARLAGKALH